MGQRFSEGIIHVCMTLLTEEVRFVWIQYLAGKSDDPKGNQSGPMKAELASTFLSLCLSLLLFSRLRSNGDVQVFLINTIQNLEQQRHEGRK